MFGTTILSNGDRLLVGFTPPFIFNKLFDNSNLIFLLDLTSIKKSLLRVNKYNVLSNLFEFTKLKLLKFLLNTAILYPIKSDNLSK